MSYQEEEVDENGSLRLSLVLAMIESLANPDRLQHLDEANQTTAARARKVIAEAGQQWLELDPQLTRQVLDVVEATLSIAARMDDAAKAEVIARDGQFGRGRIAKAREARTEKRIKRQAVVRAAIERLPYKGAKSTGDQKLTVARSALADAGLGKISSRLLRSYLNG